MTRAFQFVAVLLLLLVSCGDDGTRTVIDLAPPEGQAPTDLSDGFAISAPTQPPPSEPSDGPVAGQLTLGTTEFLLRDEGEGCVALEISYPGLQATVERRCYVREQVLDASRTCGWLEQPDADSAGSGCHVRLPTVLYGRVTDPTIAHVCVGFEGRFVAVDEAGFILEPVGADGETAAHLFTADGLRYGTPPLDAPSAGIYRACEAKAPWGVTGIEYLVAAALHVDEELLRDDIAVELDTGLDRVAAPGGTIRDEGIVPELPLRVGSSSPGLTVSVLIGEDISSPNEVISFDHAWPESISAVLGSGTACAPGAVAVIVEVGAAILDGDPTAVRLSAGEISCNG